MASSFTGICTVYFTPPPLASLSFAVFFLDNHLISSSILLIPRCISIPPLPSTLLVYLHCFSLSLPFHSPLSVSIPPTPFQESTEPQFSHHVKVDTKPYSPHDPLLTATPPISFPSPAVSVVPPSFCSPSPSAVTLTTPTQTPRLQSSLMCPQRLLTPVSVAPVTATSSVPLPQDRLLAPASVAPVTATSSIQLPQDRLLAPVSVAPVTAPSSLPQDHALTGQSGLAGQPDASGQSGLDLGPDRRCLSPLPGEGRRQEDEDPLSGTGPSADGGKASRLKKAKRSLRLTVSAGRHRGRTYVQDYFLRNHVFAVTK